jgi:hypothetical protein
MNSPTGTKTERLLVKAPKIIGAIVAFGFVAMFIRSIFPAHLPGPDAAADMAGFFFIPLFFACLLALVFALMAAIKWKTLSKRAQRNGLLPGAALVALLVVIELLPMFF